MGKVTVTFRYASEEKSKAVNFAWDFKDRQPESASLNFKSLIAGPWETVVVFLRDGDDLNCEVVTSKASPSMIMTRNPIRLANDWFTKRDFGALWTLILATT